MTVMLEVDLPDDLARLRLPPAVADRLTALLDQQDAGVPLTPAERAEAEGLVHLSDLLSLMRLRRDSQP